MWTALLLLSLGGLCSTVSSSPPSPVNVAFSSVNLRNVLQWSPGNGTQEDTHFTVQYAIYGDNVEGSKGRRVHWRAVQQCTEMVRSWCDLSNETWDQEQGYYARVRAVARRASSKWAVTQRRFDPKSDTTFGPPLVSMEIDGNTAIITLKGPMRYQPNNHTPVVSMATLYPQMSYNLSVHNARRGQTHHFLVVSSPYKYQLMQYETEYCFSAKTRFLSMPVQCQPSAPHCITTPQDPVHGHLQTVVWAIIGPSLCLCVLIVVGYFLHNYLMGEGQKNPYILNPPSFHHPPLTIPCEKHNNFILISVIKEQPPPDADSATSNHERHIGDPPPRYSPQRPEAPPEPERPLDDLSVDYACVGVAPTISVGGEAEARERRHDGGEDGNSLTGKCQKCTAGGTYEKKDWRFADSHSAGVDAPGQRPDCAHAPLHSQSCARTEMSALVQAQPWSHLQSALLPRVQGSAQSFQGATRREVGREKDDRECAGLFLRTGLFQVPLDLQREEGGMGEEMVGKVSVRTDGKIDGAAEEGRESEKVALLSAYASQNVKDMPTHHADQSDFLPNDYGVIGLATAHSLGEDDDDDDDDDEEESEQEGTICINWDPETRKLVVPELAMKFREERGLGDGSMQGEEAREARTGGEGEVDAVKGGLRLENVYVRQASEEEAAAQREAGTGGEGGWEADDVLTKWNLVISMDQ